MDIIIIKLYRNEDTTDMRDLKLDEFTEKINTLKKYGESINKKILFTVLSASEIAECNFSCFAEVEYSGEITQSEKDYIDEFLCDFSVMGEYDYSGKYLQMNHFQTLEAVIFKKLQNADIITFNHKNDL